MNSSVLKKEMVLVASSIPPRIERAQDSTLGSASDIRERVIYSWRRHGFQIASINTAAEVDREAGLRKYFQECGIKSLCTPATPGALPPYLPNLHAMIAMACTKAQADIILLTNADIIFDLDDASLNAITGTQEKECFIAHRWDIDSLDGAPSASNGHSTSGYKGGKSLGQPRMNQAGFDVFIAHKSLFLKSLDFLPESLTFGMPWWDLLLPIAMQAAGGRIKLLNPRQFLHVRHQERSWGYRWYNKIGGQTVLEMKKKLEYSELGAGASSWLEATEDAYTRHRRPRYLLREFKVRLGRYRRSIWEEPMAGWLAEVQRITLSHVRDSNG